MSVPGIPKIAAAFNEGETNEVTPPQGDIVELIVHLGATKEISSFEMLLQNWDGQYTKATKTPLLVGMTAKLSVGRYPNNPLYFLGRIEEIEARDYAEEEKADEHYMLIKGRDEGRQLFGRLVTKIYTNKKGEAIVRDIIDNFTNLNHLRESSNLAQDAAGGQKDVIVVDGSKFSIGDPVKIQDDNASEYNKIYSIASNLLRMVNNLANTYTLAANGKVSIDLIEETDTTFTELKYIDTPVFDILKYMAENCDKGGTIGYDFRIEFDGLFAFFAINSKISPISTDEALQVVYYKRSISRVRNKIKVEGAIGALLPRDGDDWTEPASDPPPNWVAVSSGCTLSREAGTIQVGIYSVRAQDPSPSEAHMDFKCDTYAFLGSKAILIKERNKLLFWVYVPSATGLFVRLLAPDASNSFYTHSSLSPQAGWSSYTLSLGENEEYDAEDKPDGTWEVIGSPSWFDIRAIQFEDWSPPANDKDMIIDGLHFSEMRWDHTEEDLTSQTNYGIRELAIVDEELYSDMECELRAKALLAYLKEAIDYVIVHSDVLDYGTNRLQAADEMSGVDIPNLGLTNQSYRIGTVEIRASGKDQTLHVRMELGREAPQLADYLFLLRQRARKSMRYKVES